MMRMITANLVCALNHGNHPDFSVLNEESTVIKIEQIRDFITKVMQEITTVAKACGVNNTETMIEEAFNSFDKMIPDGKTSMLQDVESGRKTEAKIFSDTIIELGEKYNIPTPYNEFLKQMLDIIDYNK